MGRLTAALALACLLAAVPGVAGASTVTVDPVTGQAVFTGGSSPNDVSMSVFGPGPNPFPGGPALWFSDAAQDLNAGAECIAGVAVWCRAYHAQVNLDGGDDRFHGAFSYGWMTVNGGTGADHLRANGITNIVSGGPGPDWILAAGNNTGYGYGDSGDDNLRSGVSIETVLSGGSGSDLVYGERDRNSLSGESGNDYLILRTHVGSGSLTGDGGDDVMLAVDGGFARVSGGDGGDLIVGHGRTVVVSGDAGDDVIDVNGDAGLRPDTVDCGSGDDTVYADAAAVIADDCENRLEGPMPPSERVDAALARLADAFGVTIAG